MDSLLDVRGLIGLKEVIVKVENFVIQITDISVIVNVIMLLDFYFLS